MRLAEMYRLFNQLHSEAVSCRDPVRHGILLDQMEAIAENAKRLVRERA